MKQKSIQMKSAMRNDKGNNGNHATTKKNIKSAAKKRNNNTKELEYSIDDSLLLEYETAENNYNADKKYSLEELFADYEKPMQVYAYLGLRNKYHPIFLTRNLSYMNSHRRSSEKKKFEDLLSDLYNKKLQQQTQCGVKSIKLTFLSLNHLISAVNEVNGGYSTKKKAKLENGRRSMSSKAFIEVYTFNELTLLGKCEITSIIEGNRAAASSSKTHIDIEINSKFQIIHNSKNTLLFRLIYYKDFEIEFTNTFNLHMDLCDSSTHSFSISMHEMKQNGNNSSVALDMLHDHRNANSLFHALPTLEFQIDIQNYEVPKSLRRSNSKLQYSSSSSISSCMLYQSPMTSPIKSELTKKKQLNGHAMTKLNNSNASHTQTTKTRTTTTTLSDGIELYYQFIGKNNIKILTRFDRNNNKNQLFLCPFCYLNCKFFDALLKHLVCNHFRFEVECIPSVITPSVNKIQFNISINDSYNGSNAGNCYDAHSAYGYSLSRYRPMKRIPVTFIYVCKKTNLDYSNDAIDINAVNEMKAMSATNGLEKCFYHTRGCTVIDPHELHNDLVDSDSELDPEWLQEQTALFMQDFADVNQGEKEIMRLWNLHILHNNFISDAQVFSACETFIEKSGAYMIANNLVNNFYLHLANLNDYGLLDALEITKLCDLLFLSKETKTPATANNNHNVSVH